MKHFLLLLLLTVLSGFTVYSQDQPPQTQQPAAAQTQQTISPQKLLENHIKSGFYLKLGAVMPMGEYANQQLNLYRYQGSMDTIIFNQAKFGGSLDLGYLIYLGPAFAGRHLRAGIDATFLAVSFNPTDQVLPPNSSSSKKYEYWYYFAAQKFGPLLTINPVDRLMIDLSYKLSASAAWYHSMVGTSFTLNEVSLGIRYRVILVACQYNWGKLKFKYNHDDNPEFWVDTSTFRILLGIKI